MHERLAGGPGFDPRVYEIFCYNFLKLFQIIPLMQYNFTQW